MAKFGNGIHFAILGVRSKQLGVPQRIQGFRHARGIGGPFGYGSNVLSLEGLIDGFIDISSFKIRRILWCLGTQRSALHYECRSEWINSLLRCFEYPVSPISRARALSWGTVQSS